MKINRQYKVIFLVLLIIMIPFLLSWPKMMDKKIRTANSSTDIIVLNYHKIDIADTALAIAPNDFDSQMAYLKNDGYISITPDELLDYLEFGKPLPTKSVLITFDDGYADNYNNAYPILKKYGMKATIFVITDYLNLYSNYITWEQAKEMSDNGIHIASHTMQHKPLTEFNEAELCEELLASAGSIAAHTGKATKYIAYPTGAYNLRIAEIVKQCGYRAAFTIKYGNVGNASNRYALERVPVFKAKDSLAAFIDRIEYLPFYERLGIIKT